MSKLTAQDDGQTRQFKPKIYQSKREDKQDIFMIADMVREMIKINVGQIVGIGEYHSVLDYNMDRIIGINLGIIRIIEVILEEEPLE